MKMSKKRDQHSSKELTDFAYNEIQISPIVEEKEETTQEESLIEE